MAYEALFDPDTVMTVDIQVEESAWETMLENATAETYIQCDIVVNGTTYYWVGIRPQGQHQLKPGWPATPPPTGSASKSKWMNT